MKHNPKNIRFIDLYKVCDYYFGKARQGGISHRVYRTPWQGDPRVNIQSKKGKARAYQVRQVLKAIERLELQAISKIHLAPNYGVASLFNMLTYSPHCMLRLFIGSRLVLERNLYF